MAIFNSYVWATEDGHPPHLFASRDPLHLLSCDIRGLQRVDVTHGPGGSTKGDIVELIEIIS